MKPDGTLTSNDVRAIDCIWIKNNRIIYAIEYGGRVLKVEEYSIPTKTMVCPPELAGDNTVVGTAATPKLMTREDTGQVRVYWTEQDNGSGNWKLRFKDLPFFVD